MKILVIQQKMIGDVLTSTILFEELRKLYPEARLDYLINSHTQSVIENNPFIDNLKLFTPEIEDNIVKLYKFIKSIKREQYDIVIDVYSKLSSNLITIFSEAKTKISYHKPYTTRIYHFNIKRQKSTNQSCGLAIVNRLQLLEPLVVKPKPLKPKIYLTEAEKESAQALLRSHNIGPDQHVFMISVLGSGEKKTYPYKYMAKVIDTIVEETKATLLFNYIPNQESQAKAIYMLCEPITRQHINFDLFGKSLREFMAILCHCDAIIGNEGGAMNMAKALEVKTFSIFSPWIDKATWNIFEEENKNVSVHLKDYLPEIYNSRPEKKMKDKVFSLYMKFDPDFFKSKLLTFLKQSTRS